MKIKRYFAKDIRQAMKLVRDEQGPDAVILSNQRSQDGVELVAAIDYDENDLEQFRATASETQRVSSRPSREKRQRDVSEERQPSTKTESVQNRFQWSQDPLLIEMKQEIEGVKSLLRDQLSVIAWNEAARTNPYRARLIRQLLRMGLSAGVCKEVVTGVSTDMSWEQMWRHAEEYLVSAVPMAKSDWLAQGGVLAMIGPTGVGKTTTTAKIAAQGAMRFGSHQVALITIDNYRVGAFEQLRTYGRILNIPVRHAHDRDTLVKALNDFAGKRLVLIDSAGMSQHDQALVAHLDIVMGINADINPLLLMSATTSLRGLMDIVESFRRYQPAGCILTKLDEAVSLGGAISAIQLNRLPLVYTCNGQNVPQDILLANGPDLVRACFELGDNAPDDEAFEFTELTGSREVVNARF